MKPVTILDKNTKFIAVYLQITHISAAINLKLLFWHIKNLDYAVLYGTKFTTLGQLKDYI